MGTSRYCTRDDSARREATRDPIFLLLVETAYHRNTDKLPAGWCVTEESVLYVAGPDATMECSCENESDDDPPCLWCEMDGWTVATHQQIRGLIADGEPIAIDTKVESVWLTRAECEAWIASHRYRWSSDDKVYCYCVCAEGELATVLRDGTELNKPRGSAPAAAQQET